MENGEKVSSNYLIPSDGNESPILDGGETKESLVVDGSLMDCIDESQTDQAIYDEHTDEESSSPITPKSNKLRIRSRIESVSTLAHKGSSCSNFCQVCEIPFGILDNPIHLIDSSSEDLKSYIQTSTSWNLEYCLCGICFKGAKHMFRSITQGDSLVRKSVSEKICCISDCSGETYDKLVASDAMKREIYAKYDVKEANKSLKFLCFCFNHFTKIKIDFARKCAVCDSLALCGISKIQKFKDPEMVDAFNKVLLERGKSVKLDQDSELCRECKGKYSNYIYKRHRNFKTDMKANTDERGADSANLIIKTRKQQTRNNEEEASPEKLHYSPFHEAIPCSDRCSVCMIKFATYDVPIHGENFKLPEVQVYFVETTHLPLNACICPKCFKDIKYNYSRSLENQEAENSKPCVIEKCEDLPNKSLHFKYKVALKVQELSGLTFCKIYDSGKGNIAKTYEFCTTHWKVIKSVLEPPNQCVTCKIFLERNTLFAPFRKNSLTVNMDLIERVNKCLTMDGRDEEIDDESQLCHHCHSYWMKKAETSFNKDGHYIKPKSTKCKQNKQLEETPKKESKNTSPPDFSDSILPVMLPVKIEETQDDFKKLQKRKVEVNTSTLGKNQSFDVVTLTINLKRAVCDRYLETMREFNSHSHLLSTLLDLYNNFKQPQAKKAKLSDSTCHIPAKALNIDDVKFKSVQRKASNQLTIEAHKSKKDAKKSSPTPKIVKTTSDNKVEGRLKLLKQVRNNPLTSKSKMKDFSFNSAEQLRNLCKELSKSKTVPKTARTL